MALVCSRKKSKRLLDQRQKRASFYTMLSTRAHNNYSKFRVKLIAKYKRETSDVHCVHTAWRRTRKTENPNCIRKLYFDKSETVERFEVARSHEHLVFLRFNRHDFSKIKTPRVFEMI